MKKYELTEEKKVFLGTTLYRIRALKDFELLDGTIIHAGDLGGWVEKEDNLSQEDSARVFDKAQVCDKARVSDKARIFGNARVSGNVWVFGDVWVCGEAEVYSTTHVMTFGPAGSRNSTTTFYRNKNNGISVTCGCFNGSIEDFLAKVEITHGDNKHGPSGARCAASGTCTAISWAARS